MRRQISATLYVYLGHFALATGIVGVFLPILPTTPFVILAAYCYERGSPRFHALLLENKYIGSYLNDWKQTGSIPLRAKCLAVTMITLSIGYIVWAAPLLIIKVLMSVIGVSVSAYILTRPTANNREDT